MGPRTSSGETLRHFGRNVWHLRSIPWYIAVATVVHRGRIRGISRTHPGDISVTSEGHLGHIWKTSGSADDCRPGTGGMIFGRRG
jgi:hypothetical protein